MSKFSAQFSSATAADLVKTILANPTHHLPFHQDERARPRCTFHVEHSCRALFEFWPNSFDIV